MAEEVAEDPRARPEDRSNLHTNVECSWSPALRDSGEISLDWRSLMHWGNKPKPYILEFL